MSSPASRAAGLKREGELGPGELLALLEEVRKSAFTGVLELSAVELESAIAFADGALVDARFNVVGDARQIRGEDAIFRALSLPSSTYYLKTRAAASIPPTRLTALADLLPAFESFREELEERAALVGGLGQVWGVRYAVLRVFLEQMPSSIKPVIQLLDGERSVAQVVSMSPLDENLTVRVLQKLLSQGALEVPLAKVKRQERVAPEPKPDPEPDPVPDPEPDPEPPPEPVAEPEPEPAPEPESEPEPEPTSSPEDDELLMEWLGEDTSSFKPLAKKRPAWIGNAAMAALAILIAAGMTMIFLALSQPKEENKSEAGPPGINARD